MRHPRPHPRRITRSALALSLAAASLGLTACSGSPGSSATAAVTKARGDRFGDCQVSGPSGDVKLHTVHPGTLTVAGDLPSPGWWNGDTVAQIKSGFECCLAAEIAHRAGLSRLQVENVSFDALVAGKSQGFDLAMAEISITPARRKVVDFSTPYFDSNIGVLAKPGSVTAATVRNLRIGVKQGTTGAAFVQNRLTPRHPVQVFPGDAEMLAALKAGRIDAEITDTTIVLGKAQQSGGTLAVVGQYRTGESYGALFPKGSSDEAAVDRTITQLKADGTLNRLSRDTLTKAFGGDPSSVPVWSL